MLKKYFYMLVFLLQQYKIKFVLKTFDLDVRYYHVTHVFQSESTLYSCLYVKQLHDRNRRDIWSLSDSNGIRTYNQVVRKWMLNQLG